MMITSAADFKRYIESDNDEERARAYGAAPDEVWISVLSEYPELSREVASNNTISMNVLECLSLSSDVEVRWDVASKRRINRSIFERLAHDADISVRHRIACNPKVPKDILAELAVDQDAMIAEAAKKRLSRKNIV